MIPSHSARRERSQSPRVAQVVEHDLTRFDSDDVPLSRLTHIDTPSHVGRICWPLGEMMMAWTTRGCMKVIAGTWWQELEVRILWSNMIPGVLDRRVPCTVPALAESSSVHSESCCEREDRSDDQGVEWGLMPDPVAPHSDPELPRLCQRLASRRLVWLVEEDPRTFSAHKRRRSSPFICWREGRKQHTDLWMQITKACLTRRVLSQSQVLWTLWETLQMNLTSRRTSPGTSL